MESVEEAACRSPVLGEAAEGEASEWKLTSVEKHVLELGICINKYNLAKSKYQVHQCVAINVTITVIQLMCHSILTKKWKEVITPFAQQTFSLGDLFLLSDFCVGS